MIQIFEKLNVEFCKKKIIFEDFRKMEPKKLKVILIGCSGVGKTCLITRWNEDRFDPNNLSTIGAGITSIIVSIDDVDYNLQVWDTAGQDSLREVTSLYFRDSLAAMVVFDVSNRESFSEISSWIELLQSKTSGVPFMIVGNKFDLAQDNPNSNCVKLDELSEKADHYSCSYFLTSAKTGYGVNECFQELATLALSPRITPESRGISNEPQVVDISTRSQGNSNNNKSCCG